MVSDLLFLPAHGLRGELSSSLQVGIGSGNKSGSPGASWNLGFAPLVGEEMDLWGLFVLCLTSYFPNRTRHISSSCNSISVPVIPFLSAEEEGRTGGTEAVPGV